MHIYLSGRSLDAEAVAMLRDGGQFNSLISFFEYNTEGHMNRLQQAIRDSHKPRENKHQAWDQQPQPDTIWREE